MNPQFCPTFHPIPRFVPVVARPTALVGYSNLPLSSSCHIPAFQAPLSADVPFTQASSKTRKDLEQLGSPIADKSLNEVIFELAAQKNGIRIGTVSNKAKQSNSLEDFKKIAERNGITVNPAGSNLKIESEKAEMDSNKTLSALNEEPSSISSDEAVNKEVDVCEVKNFAENLKAEVKKGMHSKSPVAYISMDKAEMSGIKVENSTSVVKGSAGNHSGDSEKEMAADNCCHVIYSKSSKCSSTNELVSNTLESMTEDKKICSQSRIAVGRFSDETNDEEETENNKAEGVPEVLDVIEQDHQVARFQEMARLNGIKVGEGTACNTREVSGDSCTEYTDSGCGMNLQHSNFDPAVDIDPKIARFQELAWLNGIKVGMKSSRTPSISSVSSCDSTDDQSNPQLVEKWPIICNPHCSDSFQEDATRNGIKLSKMNFSKGKPFMSKCIDNNCSLATPCAKVSVEASSQTEVTVMGGCQCQKQDSYNEVSGKSEGVHFSIAVSDTNEVLEEDYLLWKYDDNVLEDETKLCYKDLYFHERKKREQLTASLRDEKGGIVSTKHNQKIITDELREELNLKSKECEGLKTELKAAKKHKDAEIKQIIKELKLRQEELEKTKTNLQLKEVAVKGLMLIVQEQTAKIKDLEKEVEDAQHALFQVLKNKDWKTCQRKITDSKSFTATAKKVLSDDDDEDGRNLFLGKRQRNPSKKDAQSGSTSPLCKIDCADSPCVNKQCFGQTTSSDATIQSSSASTISFDSVSQTSSDDGYVDSGESSLVGETDRLKGDQQNKPVNGDTVTAGSGNFPSSPQTHHQSAFCIAKSNADVQQVAEGSSAQQASHAIYPSTLLTQPYPLPAVPPELLSQCLSNHLQVMQNLQTFENVPPFSNFSGSVRRPPGLNTEPVPEGQMQTQQKLPSSGKFSSFDKLMVALQERFPSKNRQELIAFLKKAKAGCGAAGFKGMQIPDVVKCVEDIVEIEEKQKS